MDISYKWLKRYIDFTLAPKELAAALTAMGLECDTVEEVESIRGGLRGIVIGKVLTCESHPNSDHLHITTVDLGNGEPTQIVCGAPNVAVGQTVVVATVGATLYDGDKEFQIKKSRIRGVESFGMICAEDEIGLGASHDGIMVIDGEVAPGTPAAEYFHVDSDYRLEIELTPNRVDAASHFGVARDLKALAACCAAQSLPSPASPVVRIPDVASFMPDSKDGAVKITVEDTQGCPRYCGVTIRGVKVAESPEWLKTLLVAAGQRPINNIVDITNFVLLGIGQPLHCFDLSKVEGEHIVVRTCPAGTAFTTLDGVEHKLDASDLMICDESRPMCIAGVFGGLDSGVKETTTDIFIESAYFNPTRVRRTARRHGLSTDASFRYERGADPSIPPYAARLAALLIKELAGGTICGDVCDVCAGVPAPAEIEFSFSRCAALIGKKLPEDLIKTILAALEIEVTPTDNSDIIMLRVPTYRVDVTRECDVAEEILRIYGYNNVEFGTEMHANLSQRGDTDLDYELQQKVSDRLTGKGFNEILNNSLSAVSYYEKSEQLPLSGCVTLMNPLSTDLSVMRRTLLFGGLESIAHNINRKAGDLRFYEFGNVYWRDADKEITVEKPLAPFHETMKLGLWLTGDFQLSGWDRKGIEASVFDLKGIVLNIFKVLGISEQALLYEQTSDEFFSAGLVISARAGQELCRLGILRSSLLKRFDIEQGVVFAEIDWRSLFRLAAKSEVTYSPLAKTQPVRRDLALLIDKDVTFQSIEQTVRKTEKKLLKGITLFDVYEGKSLPEGKKSYAIAITLQDDEKTLNDRQIDAVMTKITDALRKSGAELR